jgi:hypothetical protein
LGRAALGWAEGLKSGNHFTGDADNSSEPTQQPSARLPLPPRRGDDGHRQQLGLPGVCVASLRPSFCPARQQVFPDGCVRVRARGGDGPGGVPPGRVPRGGVTADGVLRRGLRPRLQLLPCRRRIPPRSRRAACKPSIVPLPRPLSLSLRR